jgi:2'-5' RNA ligase
MNTVRSFIAIEINPENRAKFIEIQKELSQINADIKLVEPHNIHLTLHFLGNQNLETIEKIKNKLKPIFEKLSTFEFQPQGLGAFPNRNNPRVIWVGIGEGSDNIENIFNHSKDVLKDIGIDLEDRKFHPHLTLARIKSGKNKHLLTQFLTAYHPPEFHLQKAEEVILFKSTLTPKGPIYEKLYSWRLKSI